MRYLEDDGSINAWVPKTFEFKSAPVTYFGFDKLDSGCTERDAFQIKGADKLNSLDPFDKSWSEGRLRAEFDTLQLYENGVPQVRDQECSAIDQERHLNCLLRHTLNTGKEMFNSCMLKIELLISTRLIFCQRNHDKFTIL